MIGKQLISNIKELAIPKIKAWWHRKDIKFAEDDEQLSRWEDDYKLIPYEGLFEEYLEMILQFGFITIFVAAFPLAPLLALLNNWIEIRLDSQKLVHETRRPIPERTKDIGAWFAILEFITRLAVICNVSIININHDYSIYN